MSQAYKPFAFDRVFAEEETLEFAYPHSHLVFDETSGELQVATGDRPPQFDGGPGRPSSARGVPRRNIHPVRAPP